MVEEQIAKRKWPHGESQQLADRYDIARDAGLKGLKEAYLAQHLGDDRTGKRFGDLFYGNAQPDTDKLYQPQELLHEGATYLYWRTVDQAPKVLSFNETEQKVKEAWYREKARPLAQAEAERIAREAGAAKGDAVRNLTDAAKGQPLITIDGIARMSRGPSARADFSGLYRPYVVPEDKIEYPRPDFVDKVLDLPNKGDVTVTPDQPAMTFYVVAVTDRIEPTQNEFQQAQLLPQLEKLRRREYRQDVLLQLHLQARLSIDPENRKQVEERSGGLPEE